MINAELKAIHLRLSDASTEDLGLSSDDEILEKCLPSLSYPMNSSGLFLPISDEAILHYQEISQKLNLIYQLLEEEIAPINIREERTIAPISVNLCTISRSSLHRRRNTIV